MDKSPQNYPNSMLIAPMSIGSSTLHILRNAVYAKMHEHSTEVQLKVSNNQTLLSHSDTRKLSI